MVVIRPCLVPGFVIASAPSGALTDAQCCCFAPPLRPSPLVRIQGVAVEQEGRGQDAQLLGRDVDGIRIIQAILVRGLI